MKQLIIWFSCVALMAAVIISCDSPASRAENVETAKKEVVEARNDLDKATAGYLADIEKYKKETALKLSANNQRIADFRARIASEKAEVKVGYERKIRVLEIKNRDMKKMMDNYKMEGREKWESFKTEFDRDMDELGKAFKDLTVKNAQ